MPYFQITVKLLTIKKQFKFTIKLHFKNQKSIPVYPKKFCTVPASVFYLPYNQILQFSRKPSVSEVVGRKKKCMGTHKGFQLLVCVGRGGREEVLKDV